MFISLRGRDQALFLAGLVAWASAAGCAKKSSESLPAGDSAASTAETPAATDSAATPSLDAAAPARAESTMAKTPPVKPSSGQGATPKPLPKPSIDPGRKPATHLGDTAPDQWLKYDAATSTVTFELRAGPFTFNGFSNGGATLTLPPKANVVINFVNKDGTPHSAEVISGDGPIPNGAGDPAIPRAYTNKALEGLPQEATDVIQFTAPESGKYRIFCGVPGHGLSGMWIWMVIDPAAKTPSFGPTKA